MRLDLDQAFEHLDHGRARFVGLGVALAHGGVGAVFGHLGLGVHDFLADYLDIVEVVMCSRLVFLRRLRLLPTTEHDPVLMFAS